MEENEILSLHDDHCECGCHDHEHEHDHDHDHEHHHDHVHDHEHEHEHEHGEHCDCGCHDHDHEHHHDHDQDHDHEHHHHGRTVDGIHVEHHMQDEACVASGEMTFSGTYAEIRPRIKAELESLAAKIGEAGGIVGHIKASAEVKQTEMFSVTETDAMIKTAPLEDLEIRLAAIVFAVDPEQVEDMVFHALKAVKS